MIEQGLKTNPIPGHRQSWAAAAFPDTLIQTILWDFSGVNNQGCDTTKFSSYLKFKQMLIQLVIINLQLDNRKTHQEKTVRTLQAELTVGIGEFSRTWAWIEGSWSWWLHRILLGWPNVWGATVTILGGQKQPSLYKDWANL